MLKYIALLHAVNVGGTAKITMADLKQLCMDAGLSAVQTYIASGNVIFCSRLAAGEVGQALEGRLLDFLGKPVAVSVRSAEAMQRICSANPFPDKSPDKTLVMFAEQSLEPAVLEQVSGRADEECRVAGTEIYVHYPQGVGRSKLKFPASLKTTARNMNTVCKLAALAGDGV